MQVNPTNFHSDQFQILPLGSRPSSPHSNYSSNTSAVPPSLGENKISLTIYFPAPEVIRAGEYHQVRVDGLESFGNPEEPKLPIRPVRVLIPFGSEVRGIRVFHGRKATLDGSYRVEPAQMPVPISSSGPIESTLPDERIYNSSHPFPARVYSNPFTQSKIGYQILILNLYPVSYVPAEGKLSYFEDMTIEIELGPSPLGGLSVRCSSEDRREIRQIVDNPEAIDSYPLELRPLQGENEYEYVIITSEALKNITGEYTFENLIESKQARDITTTIVTTEWIYANFDGTRPDGGMDNQTKIRNFIRHAYENWGTKYVLLGGDGDGGDVGRETENAIIPVREFYPGVTVDYSYIASDMYYACLDGTFDYDADGVYGEPGDDPSGGEVDLYAEVYVGRAPVDSAEEVSNFVRKTLSYERAENYFYLRNVWMAGEDLGWSVWGSEYKDEIKNGTDNYGYTTTGFENSIYADFFDVRTLYDNEEYRWTSSEIKSVIENGTHIINHLGHADVTYVMKLYNSDVDGLRNDKYFIGYSQGCYDGSFDDKDTSGNVLSEDSICEHLVCGENGAVAFVGNSRYGWGDVFSTDGPSQHFDREFWDAILSENILNLGRANQDSKEDLVWYISSDLIGRWCAYELNLFGDPELQVKLLSGSGIEGHVKNSATLENLEGAEVAVREGDLVRYADENGYFKIVLPSGTYTLDVTNFGYFDNGGISVEVVEDGWTEVEILLNPKPTGAISGKVTDNLGGPVINATVEVLNTPLDAATDENGRYVLENVPVDNYTLRASAWGYKPFENHEVEVFDGQITEVNFQLESTLRVAVLGDYRSQLTNLLIDNEISAHERGWEIIPELENYDAVVMNRPSDPDQSTFLSLLEAADSHGVGIVFTSSWPIDRYGISLLRKYKNDPSGGGCDCGWGPVYYRVVENNNPLFQGWGVGDNIIIISGGDYDHAWFSGYSGPCLSEVGSEERGIRGVGAGFRFYENSTHVLLASLGAQSYTSVPGWTDNGKLVFLRGVWWASEPLGEDTTPPPSPRLVSPVDNINIPDNTPWFVWERTGDATGISSYHLQVATDQEFLELLVDENSIVGTEYELSEELPIEEYYWKVRARDGVGLWGGWSENQSFTITAPTPANWVFMVYMDGDCNLEGAGIDDLNEMEQVGSSENVNILVLFDRHPGYDSTNGNWTTARIYYVTQDNDPYLITSALLEDWGEINMGDPSTLENFVNWTATHYPAENYVLVLWDHGGGWKPLSENIDLVEKKDKTASTYARENHLGDVAPQGICWDETNGNDYLTTAEVGAALRNIKDELGKNLDLVGLDACLMGMVEVAYEIKDYASFMVGSEEVVPWGGWPYDLTLSGLVSNPAMTPEELASEIVSDYCGYYADLPYYTCAAVNLGEVANLAEAVDNFAQQLIEGVATYEENLRFSRSNSQEYSDYDYIDLYHFAQLIRENVPDENIQATAENVMNKVNQTVIAENHGSEVPNSHGLSIYFPLNSSEYNSQYVIAVNFAKDTQWGEFLRTFYELPAWFAPPHSDYGLDTDNDNLYNYLVVEVGVEVEKAGQYQVSSSLYDNAYNYITYAWTENYLEPDNHTLELRFGGYEINRSGKDGPYRVSLYLHDNEYNQLDRGEHETAIYTHDQFQPPPFTIYIENDDFFIDNGVNGGGSGIELDPYIIENWVIDASCAHGIWIRNTTKYFVIRNCLVENGGGSYAGIYLDNVINGKIENNTCKNNYYGISLYYSSNDNLTNNTCSNNQVGIIMESSSNNTIDNNICENNGGGIILSYSDNNMIESNVCENQRESPSVGIGLGIYLSSSNNNTLENNLCKNNPLGICVFYSTNDTLLNNRCENNTYNFGVATFGAGGDNISHFIHDIDNSNLVNGKPIIYLIGENNITINQDNQFGYLGLVNCENVRVENLVLENNFSGLVLAGAKNSRVENNIARNNWLGIYVSRSDNNTFQNNVCENNLVGIHLSRSDNNTISHNHLLNNTENNAYDNGINSWDESGEGNYWDDWQPPEHPDADRDGIVDEPRPILGGTNQDNYPLVLPDFSVSVSPASGSVQQGGGTTATVAVTPVLSIDNYNLTVALTASGQPSGVSVSFSPSSGVPTFSSTMTINVGSDVPTGTYSITITGTGEGKTHSCTYVLTVIVPPDQPMLYSPADGVITNNSTLTFEWTVGSNADNHRLLVDNDPDFSSPNENRILIMPTTTYTIAAENALSDGTYYWKVVAINEAGENESVVWSFVVDTVKPAAPSLVSPTDGSTTDDTTPTFDWSDISGPTGVTYTLEIVGTLTKTDLTDSTYTLTSGEALPDGTYSWHVRAIDNAGNEGDWSDTWSFTVTTAPPSPPPPPPPDTVPPPVPSLISPADGENIIDNTPLLDWSDVSDPSGVAYDLSIARDEGFTSIVLQRTDLTASAYELTSAEALADGTYYWRIRGVDGVGNIGLWSESWSFTVYMPPAPATLTADTTPIKASVYVNNVLWGVAPQTRSLVTGSYTVSFGDYLGYLTPPPQTVTLTAGETRTITGIYTEIPPELIENESPPIDIPFITTDENATIEVENTAIIGMTIDVGENVENVRITVQQLTDKPTEIAIGTPGVTYCYLNIVSENITDADIYIVLINFGVEKAWITADNMNPDSIVMRRWDPVAEVWVSLPTARIGEDGTHHYYRAESPGLSIFGITGLAPSPAEFELSNLVIDPSEVGLGEAITISVVVTNVGDLEGTCIATLKIDNFVEATENVTLAGGVAETITFTVSRDVEGTYYIEVDGLTGTFVVTAPPPMGPLEIIVVALIVVALLAMILIWLRRRGTINFYRSSTFYSLAGVLN